MEPNKASDLDRLVDKKCYTAIYNAVSQYVEDNPDALELSGVSNFVKEPDGASLSDMELIRSCNAVMNDDEIVFDAIVSCEIEIEETVRRNRETDGVRQWFKIQCRAILDETLKSFQVMRIEVYSTGKPRPVHLDMSNEMGRLTELAEINEPLYIEEAYKTYPAFRPSAEAGKVAEAAKAIDEAERPVIVAGRGARLSDAGDEIFKLAVKGDIPVVTSPDGKTLLDENDSLWAGIVGNYGMACANKTVSNADLVIFIGTQTGDQTTLNWKAPLQDVKAVQIDIEASELGKNYPRTVGLLGDAKTVTAQLAEKIKQNKHRKWREEVSGYVKTTLSEYEPFLTSDNNPIRPERLCAEISKVLPDNAVLVADTGFSAIWSATMIKMRPTQRYLRAAGSLGWAFPASLGVKCGAPERPVVCFAGDGAIYYHLSEMETACRFGIHTVTIINNNQVFGQCQKDIKKLYEGNPEKAAACFTFTSVNFSKIAEEFGCWAIRVERPEDIGPAIKKALNAGRPAVIEVLTDGAAIVPGLS